MTEIIPVSPYVEVNNQIFDIRTLVTVLEPDTIFDTQYIRLLFEQHKLLTGENTYLSNDTVIMLITLMHYFADVEWSREENGYFFHAACHPENLVRVQRGSNTSEDIIPVNIPKEYLDSFLSRHPWFKVVAFYKLQDS